MFDFAPLAWTGFPNLLALVSESCHWQKCERTSARPEPPSISRRYSHGAGAERSYGNCVSLPFLQIYTFCTYIYTVHLRNRAGFMQTAVAFLCFSHLWTYHEVFCVNQGTCLPRSSYLWRDAHFNSLLKATRLIKRLVKRNVTFCAARRKGTGGSVQWA